MTEAPDSGNHFENLGTAEKTDSISGQLLRVVFSLYCIVALSVTICHIVGEYRHTKDTIAGELRSYESIFGPVLGKALWDLDRAEISDVVKGLSEVPVIVGVKIERIHNGQRLLFGGAGFVKGTENELSAISEAGTVEPLTGREPNIHNLFSYQFPIVYMFQGESRKLGVATLYSDSSIVLTRVQVGFIFLIINAVIKGIALWVIFHMVSKRLLLKPLKTLTTAISELNFENLSNFSLHLGIKKKNELSLIEEAFLVTVNELSDARLKIVEFNEELENKVAERTADLLDSENKFRTLSDAALEGILISDGGRIINANKAIAKIFGYPSADDLIGTDALLLVNPEDRKDVQHKISIGYEEAYEINGYKKNGVSFPVESQGKMFMYKGKKVRVTAIRDLTEKKKAEAQIKTLQGIIPICMHCKGIRDDKGYWKQLEEYIESYSDVMFSHSICDACFEKFHPEPDETDS